MYIWLIIMQYPISRSLFSECCACTTYFYMCTLAGFLPLRHGWESEMWWQSWPWRRGGSGCTAAVRRCGGSVTAAMRRGGSRLISLAISALTRNAKGEEAKRVHIEEKGWCKGNAYYLLPSNSIWKKKSVSALLLHVVRCTFVHST